MSEIYRVPAVVSAIALLEALAEQPGATMSALARTCGLSKSSVYNLLATLESESLVARDAGSRTYSLGPRLIPLAAAASRATSKLSLALDHLALLADEHELSFAVARATGADQVQVLERFYPPRGVHVGIVVGDAYGPFDGALGKCLLAQMDADRAAELIDQRELPAHTEATITDAGELLAEVARVRARGWGASVRELNENNAVAAFVPEPAGASELYLLALGFANQLTDERIPTVGALLRATAEAIAAGRPPSTAAPAAAERPA